VTTIPQARKPLQQKQRHPATRKWFLGIFGVLFVFYGTAGYMATSQVMGYHRDWREFIARPNDFGLKAEVVSFNSQDGIPLKGWWLPAEGTARGNLVLVHGKDGNRSHMLSRAHFLVRNGYNVLAIDLRDHGESGGSYISAGYLEARDILGAVGYLRQRGERAPIAILGHSYGAVAALRAIADSPEIGAVISDGAFASSKEMMDNVTRYYVHNSRTPLWVKGLLSLSNFPGVYSAAALAFYLRTGQYMAPETTTVMPAVVRIHKPVLFISGEQDFLAPTEDARRMFAAVPGTQKFLLIVHAGHNTTYKAAPTEYESTVLEFLSKTIPGR
jgi:uncharacterized protein